MSGNFELRVINKPIYYIEMVALLHRLINDRTYKGIVLSDSQNAFLDLLKGFRVKVLELFELYLYNEELGDIDALESFITETDPVDLIYLMFGEELSKADIKLLMENMNSLKEMTQAEKYSSAYSSESISLVFQRTGEFTHKLAEVFRTINTIVVEQMGKAGVYEEAVSKTSQELKAKVPLAVAQGIMGKKFVRVYDFSTYYFAPSYFFMNKPMRTFNNKTQIVIYPIGQEDNYSKSALVNALKVIADNTRLEMIRKLSARPMYGKELAAELGLVTSTVSHHLEQLRSIGLIHEERDKSVKYFSLNIKEYNKLCDAMKSFVETR
ncbi:MAG: regulatory protein ArsR [Clostridia bacterium]|jgi:DNA-binding transcriptional ArsR family regulator|nr:regulatory protein ArsR [Clostridia bacterium]